MTEKPTKWRTAAGRVFLCLWERLYRYHYGVGIHTLRLLRRIGRTAERLTRSLRRWARYQWLRYMVRPIHRFFHRQRVLSARMRPAFTQLREAAKKSVFAIFPCLWHLCRSAAKNYWNELSALGRFVGPVVAAVALIATLSIWNNVDFCLTVTYQDKELGLVENAAVYDRGAELARGRVINADDSFKVDAVPTFTMTIRGNKSMLSDTQVCDAILQQSSDSIAQASGLYVDDVFVGAMEDATDVQAVLDGLLAEGYDPEDSNQRAEFLQTTQVVEGLYPISAIEDSATLTALVRPCVQVLKVVTAVEEEEIPFTVQTVYRSDKPVTHTPITQKGKLGRQEVVKEYVYLDGTMTEVRRVEVTVLKQPVAQIQEIGTKPTYAADGTQVEQGDGIATGKWTWPVPVCRNIYQGYHGGHLAIDISSGGVPVFNKPCLAADGGKVVYAGWYYDYGYYVKIDHGNGVYTTYAHLNSISVVVGQLVSNGQQIGRVGNSGYSKGPHLHFELIKNGVKVNPVRHGIKP